MSQIASCIERCDDSESGEYEMIRGLYGEFSPEYEDLVGAQLIIDPGAETSKIRYTRDGTTYEVRRSLADL
ncbi:hypothetical protein [Enhygromyxa salina]|nr:hypothetical protein [Enhygromyxa salina]